MSFPHDIARWRDTSLCPSAGVLAHRWWYKLWALLGIRNEYQKGLSADEVADRNSFYFVEALNYVPNSCYEVVWHRLGYDYKWVEKEYLDTSERALLRIVGKFNRMLPLVGWLGRTFRSRHVFLRKPIQAFPGTFTLLSSKR
jgi:hypothetical protein